jgi:hypothetical protein
VGSRRRGFVVSNGGSRSRCPALAEIANRRSAARAVETGHGFIGDAGSSSRTAARCSRPRCPALVEIAGVAPGGLVFPADLETGTSQKDDYVN